MSLLSTGGTSYPDVIFLVLLAIPLLASSVLNPIVFYYNLKEGIKEHNAIYLPYRMKLTVPRFLYKVLAMFDFLTCLLLPINSIYKISIKEDPNCYFYEYYGMYHCNAYFYPKLWERIAGVVIYTLLVTPNCLLAVLATIRYIQIKNPFAQLKIRYCVLFIFLYVTYTLVVFSLMFSDELAYYLSLSQTVENIFFVTRTVNQTEVLAMFQLYRYSRKAQRSGTTTQIDNNKASLRIFIANAGGLIYTAMHLIWYFGLSDWETSEVQVICFFIYNNLLPLYLSCFNPIIFIIFTDDFFKKLRSGVDQVKFKGATYNSGVSSKDVVNNGKCSRQTTTVTVVQ
ncbi:hypothetical protein ACHWQZ_G000078 [Mnemiopsis leidyi]